MEYEVHTGHYSDWDDDSVFPINDLSRARKVARRVAARTGSAVIWEQSEAGISAIETYEG